MSIVEQIRDRLSQSSRVNDLFGGSKGLYPPALSTGGGSALVAHGVGYAPGLSSASAKQIKRVNKKHGVGDSTSPPKVHVYLKKKKRSKHRRFEVSRHPVGEKSNGEGDFGSVIKSYNRMHITNFFDSLPEEIDDSEEEEESKVWEGPEMLNEDSDDIIRSAIQSLTDKKKEFSMTKKAGRKSQENLSDFIEMVGNLHHQVKKEKDLEHLLSIY